MTEEYYEKHGMEIDLGDEVEPYTEEDLLEMERNLFLDAIVEVMESYK